MDASIQHEVAIAQKKMDVYRSAAAWQRLNKYHQEAPRRRIVENIYEALILYNNNNNKVKLSQ
jgi:hypothetical protein